MSLKQFFTAGEGTSLSSSTLWFHIMNAAILLVYLGVSWKVILVLGTNPINASQLIDSIMVLTGVISAIITGNKIGNLIVKNKTGVKDEVATK